jgi:hypothetical protein
MKETSPDSSPDLDLRFTLVGERTLLIAGWNDAAIKALGAPARSNSSERFWRLDAVKAAIEERCAGQAGSRAKTGD